MSNFIHRDSREWTGVLDAAENEVKSTLAALPEDLRERAALIPVCYDHVPSKALMRDGVPADTMGLFVGGTFLEDESGDEALPPEIILYLDNILAESENDMKEFRFQVRQTLLHEIGHYLGLDEEALEERGLE